MVIVSPPKARIGTGKCGNFTEFPLRSEWQDHRSLRKADEGVEEGHCRNEPLREEVNVAKTHARRKNIINI